MAFERNKTIPNLIPYTNYSIEMVANTSAGYGRRSNLSYQLTQEAGVLSLLKSSINLLTVLIPEDDVNLLKVLLLNEIPISCISDLHPFMSYFNILKYSNALYLLIVCQ